MRSCLVVTDRPRLAAALTAGLEARSITCHRVEPAHGFAERRRRAARRGRSRRTGRRRRRRPRRGDPADDRRPTRRGGSRCWPSTAGSSSTSTRRRLGPGRRRLRRGRRPPGPAGDPHRRHHRRRPQSGPGLGPAGPGRRRCHRRARHRLRRQHRGRRGGRPPGRSGALVAHLLSHPEAARSGRCRAGGGRRLDRPAQPPPADRGSITYGGPAVPDWLDATLREIVGAAATGTVGGGRDDRPRPPASSTPTCTSGTRPAPTGTRTWLASSGRRRR